MVNGKAEWSTGIRGHDFDATSLQVNPNQAWLIGFGEIDSQIDEFYGCDHSTDYTVKYLRLWRYIGLLLMENFAVWSFKYSRVKIWKWSDIGFISEKHLVFVGGDRRWAPNSVAGNEEITMTNTFLFLAQRKYLLMFVFNA